MLTQAGSPVYMSHVVTGEARAPLGGTASGPLAGEPTAAITAATPLRRGPDRQATASPHRGDAPGPLGGTASGTRAGTSAAAITAASPFGRALDRQAMAGPRRGEARAPLGGTAGGPRAGTATAVITAASPFGRALDQQAMAGDGTAPPRGGLPAGNATAELTVASPLQRASADAATVRPAPALGRWHRHGDPEDRCSPPAPFARDDPRFARLPYGDGAIHRFGCEAATAESVTLAVGLLRSAGWRVHRSGAAMAAHHPSGRRWIVGWTVGDQCPAWHARLPVLATEHAE